MRKHYRLLASLVNFGAIPNLCRLLFDMKRITVLWSFALFSLDLLAPCMAFIDRSSV